MRSRTNGPYRAVKLFEEPPAVKIIGTGFELWDFVAYFAGACLVIAGETAVRRCKYTRRDTPG